MSGNVDYGALRQAKNANCKTVSAPDAVNGPFLLKTGGTMTGPIIFSVDQPTGTTAAAGIVQLEDSVSSTSTTTAATPNSVKSANDAAVVANALASNALPKSGGTLVGAVAFSGSGALASPLLNGTIRVDKLSGDNGPFRIINGGPWVDPGAPTQPVVVFQPVNSGIGINLCGIESLWPATA